MQGSCEKKDIWFNFESKNSLKGTISGKIIAGVFMLILLVLTFPIGIFYNQKNSANDKPMAVTAIKKETKVLGEENEKLDPPIPASENFKATQLNLDDGLGISVVDFEESAIFKISNVKSEIYSSKDGDKDEFKGIINCNTTKRANVELEYYKSGSTDKKKIRDLSYSLEHSLTLPTLDPDSVYKYSIRATDTSGNQIASEQFVFYTGAPNVSLIDVLENAVRKVFGWALGDAK